jgi:sec-independent protein translocase protein TatA
MFDPSAPHIIILLIVVLLLFGSRRLPGAAKSLGQSMHIFKRSVSGLDIDDDPAANPYQAGTPYQPPAAAPPALQPAAPQSAPLDPTQAQLQELQRQIQDLQKQQAASQNAGQASAGQTSQPF